MDKGEKHEIFNQFVNGYKSYEMWIKKTTSWQLLHNHYLTNRIVFQWQEEAEDHIGRPRGAQEQNTQD